MEVVQEEAKQIRAKAVITAVRYLVVGALLAALCFEGYYIFLLRATIKKQTDDLRNISVQRTMEFIIGIVTLPDLNRPGNNCVPGTESQAVQNRR